MEEFPIKLHKEKVFSEDFKKLISDPEAFQKVMEQNCSSGSYEQWEGKRRFITQAVNADGTILDIGCAGGLFLKSLQEWSEHKLIPYGIDIDERYIEEAKKLLPEYQDHFSKTGLRKTTELPSLGFPDQYDFVYVSIIPDKKYVDFIKNTLLPMAKKRLILGFYGTEFIVGSKGWEEEREGIKKRLEEFKNSELAISGTALNPTDFNQAIAWIDVG